MIRLEELDKASIPDLLEQQAFPLDLRTRPSQSDFDLFVSYFHQYCCQDISYLDQIKRASSQGLIDKPPFIPVGRFGGIFVLGGTDLAQPNPLPHALGMRVIVSEKVYDELFLQFSDYLKAANSETPKSVLFNKPGALHEFLRLEEPTVQVCVQFCSDCMLLDKDLTDALELILRGDPDDFQREDADYVIANMMLRHLQGDQVFPINLSTSLSGTSEVIDIKDRQKWGLVTVFKSDGLVVSLVDQNSSIGDVEDFFYSRSIDHKHKDFFPIPCPVAWMNVFSDLSGKSSSSVTDSNLADMTGADQELFEKLSSESNQNLSSEKVFYVNPAHYASGFFRDAGTISRNIIEKRTPKIPLRSAIISRENLTAPYLTLCYLFNVSIEQGASDIHIEQYESTSKLRMCIIRIRVDAKLKKILELPLAIISKLNGVLKSYAGLDSDKAIPDDGSIMIHHTEHGEWTGRVQALPCNNNNVVFEQNITIRLSQNLSTVGDLSLEKIGFENRDLTIFKAAIERPDGINIITGPTGSGKTTTLYAALNHINKPDVKILAAESPIEKLIPGINQSDVGKRNELSFTNFLKPALRFDPEVILVGEIREKNEATLAVQAALTGHLIFTSLHTNTAIGAIPRLLNMGIDADLLSDSIRVIQGQRLIRTLCPKCKQKAEITARQKKQFEDAGISPPTNIYKPVGCGRCTGGYKGRVMIVELLPFSEDVRNLVMDHERLGFREMNRQLKEVLRKEGVNSLYQNGLLKVKQGLSTLEEVNRWNTDWTSLDR